MKFMFINTVCGIGSTGRIVSDLYNLLRERGNDVKVIYGYGNAKFVNTTDAIKSVNKIEYYIHNFLAKCTDKTGLYSIKATKRIIEEIAQYNPDVIHLHNLHGYYINYKMLFNYFSEINTPVFWTLHDCWNFTGHCTNFSISGCEQWKECCQKCDQLLQYPKCYFNGNVQENYLQKKASFLKKEELVLITPSHWLSSLVQQSFLGTKPIETIPNGIDLKVFHPNIESFVEAHKKFKGKIVLAVANGWNERKGLNDVIKLASRLGNQYMIVIVGVNGQQKKMIQKNMIGIPKTNDIKELVEIYSSADVFINPTYEDNFPTVNLEALACGTPVVTYKTGGSAEAIDATCGIVVNRGDLSAMLEAIPQASHLNREDAVARSKMYDKNIMLIKYMRTYSKYVNVNPVSQN